MEYAVSLIVNVIVSDKNEGNAVQQAVDIVEQISNAYVVGVNSCQLNTYMAEA